MDMAEIDEPGAVDTFETRHRVRVRPFDIIAFTIIIIVIVSMSVFIVNRLRLKHNVEAVNREAASAKVVTSKVIDDLAKQDTAAIRALGDQSFQAKNSAESLDAALTFHPENSSPIKFSELYGDSKPTVDQQIVANNTRGQHVALIYKYDKLKVPFYVRVDVSKTPNSDTWTLQALSASSDEASLLTK